MVIARLTGAKYPHVPLRASSSAANRPATKVTGRYDSVDSVDSVIHIIRLIQLFTRVNVASHPVIPDLDRPAPERDPEDRRRLA
jgi:hypothetical protein